MILSKERKDFKKFKTLLEEKVNFRKVNGKITWNCEGDRKMTVEILNKYFPKYNIEGTLKYFDERGGRCDCEVIFNVISGD